MTRAEGFKLGVAAAVAAAASVATSPLRGGWGVTAPADTTTMRFADSSDSHRSRYVAHINPAAAAGTRRRVGANELHVQLSGEAKWTGGLGQDTPSTLEIGIAFAGEDRPIQHFVPLHHGVPERFTRDVRLRLDHAPSGCTDAGAGGCDVEFEVSVRWVDGRSGAVNVGWTVGVTAFGNMMKRRDKQPPKGAAVTVTKLDLP